MKKMIEFELVSDANDSFFCQKAANSVDLDIAKKLKHEMKIETDFPDDWNVGLIVGASGSGKTTLAKHLYGADCFETYLDLNEPVINQFNDNHLSYDDRVAQLISVGLSQVPCWIRPAGTLSNGQRFRAEIALQLAMQKEATIIDEWTSVVDRTIGKIMSHAVQKHVRRFEKKIVLCSCHYDVIEWLQPNWIIDCNEQTFRRSLRTERQEKLKFEVREVSKDTWKYFSKYHYLSEKLPAGRCFYFGLFHEDKQIGFQAFSNYTPHKNKDEKMILHSNRLVIHPDYVGLGLGIKLTNAAANTLKDKYRIMQKFSNRAVLKSIQKDKNWKFINASIFTSTGSLKSYGATSNKTRRNNVKWWSYEYLPNEEIENS